jgi:putative flavoprotein involved in K+ transport
VAIVGGGQAGLSMSHCLGERDIGHVVLERDLVGHDWRERRWDSFCLVTPNWQCDLPGFPYRGADPHGFMVRDEVLDYLAGYARSFDPPLHEGVEVTRLAQEADGGYGLETSDGAVRAEQVVVATGGYHHPLVPPIAAGLPDDLEQIHSSAYRNPEALPEGPVLVVGTGQSGCQIAEDLHLTGRLVHLSVGSAPRTARFYRGRDVTDWLHDMGHYDVPVTEHTLGDGIRLQANHYVTGRDGGHDIDLRRFALEGMRLYGHLDRVDRDGLAFADDLGANLDHADGVAQGIKDAIDEYVAGRGLSAPEEAPYAPPWHPERRRTRLDLAGGAVRSVVWSTGYRADYRWVELAAFDGAGYPVHHRGVTPLPGLYFLGLPWLHTWGSGRFASVGRDAGYLAHRIAAVASPEVARAA